MRDTRLLLPTRERTTKARARKAVGAYEAQGSRVRAPGATLTGVGCKVREELAMAFIAVIFGGRVFFGGLCFFALSHSLVRGGVGGVGGVLLVHTGGEGEAREGNAGRDKAGFGEEGGEWSGAE